MRRVVLAGSIGLAATLCACAPAVAPLSRFVWLAPPIFAPGVTDDFPDGAPEEPVAAAVFERINRDRVSAGRSPVRWDAKAAALATEYTREQIREGTVGHFLLDGLPPYARLSDRGDLGFGSENAASYTFFGEFGPLSPSRLALDSHDEMFDERPPDDGHRRAILDPDATHVGVGWSLVGGNFRMSEEFTTRRFDRLRFTRFGSDGSVIRVQGRALTGMRIAYVSVARQEIPAPVSRDEVNARRSYAFPAPRYALIPAASSIVAAGLVNQRCLTPSLKGKFSFNYEIERPGLWTFVLYFEKKGEKPAPGGSFSVRVDAGPSPLRS